MARVEMLHDESGRGEIIRQAREHFAQRGQAARRRGERDHVEGGVVKVDWFLRIIHELISITPRTIFIPFNISRMRFGERALTYSLNCVLSAVKICDTLTTLSFGSFVSFLL